MLESDLPVQDVCNIESLLDVHGVRPIRGTCRGDKEAEKSTTAEGRTGSEVRSLRDTMGVAKPPYVIPEERTMTEFKTTWATLTAHSALLFALVQTHPDRAALRAALSQEMQKAIDAFSEDAEISGLLHSFEEQLSTVIRG